ncbi:MAG: zinc ribbon domain-containing protein, partial [Pleurocapsa sp. MO_226.B13]|nr:zinc ribbon domain-containing protein [Pleurocapsa sp. MO_226.B13]
KVDKDFSSQECSNCGAFTGKKQLNERLHHCQFCHHSESRDTNSAKILMQRGQRAVTHISHPKCDLEEIREAGRQS